MLYPLVGFILGSILYAVYLLLGDTFPPQHSAVIVFSLSVLITGALHLDGFGDSVDGLFVDKKRALEVMKDSHIGGMGMIFSVVFLMLKLSTFIYLQNFYLLPIIMMYSRLNALFAIYFYDYISSGLGQLLKDEVSFKYLLFALAYSLFFGWFFSFVGAIFISLFVLVVCGWFFTKRYGGLNGDIYGFIIEVSELVLLNYVVSL
jgi:cobalamin 5'-phosphate synthase/cobalamin synthase